MNFELHPRLGADTIPIGELALCRLLLMNDAQYPWCILVPRRPAMREIYQLVEADQQQLLRESSQLGRAMMEEFQGDKLNVGALGNLVPQLHLHHVVRRQTDPAWPAPVWGRLPPQPYASAESRRIVERLQRLLSLPLALA